MTFPAEPVRIRDRVFPSQASAAAAMGVCPSAISQSLRRHGHCDRVGLNLGGGQPGNQHPAKPITLFGETFASRKAAAKALGTNRTTIWRATRPGASEAAKSIVLRLMMEKLG